MSEKVDCDGWCIWNKSTQKWGIEISQEYFPEAEFAHFEHLPVKLIHAERWARIVEWCNQAKNYIAGLDIHSEDRAGYLVSELNELFPEGEE